jgi:hypothetical protein
MAVNPGQKLPDKPIVASENILTDRHRAGSLRTFLATIVG